MKDGGQLFALRFNSTSGSFGECLTCATRVIDRNALAGPNRVVPCKSNPIWGIIIIDDPRCPVSSTPGEHALRRRQHPWRPNCRHHKARRTRVLQILGALSEVVMRVLDICARQQASVGFDSRSRPRHAQRRYRRTRETYTHSLNSFGNGTDSALAILAITKRLGLRLPRSIPPA
jgi:hypothetical protein